jgi:hypothetical protein
MTSTQNLEKELAEGFQAFAEQFVASGKVHEIEEECSKQNGLLQT